MKAIRKSDGKEIDVVLLHPREYIDDSRRIYTPEELILDSPVDWTEFRRIAALNIYGITQAKAMTGDYEGLAKNAVEQADILINYLKKTTENNFSISPDTITDMNEFIDKLSENAVKEAREYADENTCYADDSHLQYLTTLKAFNAGAEFAGKQVIQLLEEYYKNMKD